MKSYVSVKDLTIEFPVYGIKNRSLKNAMFSNAIGGKFFKSDKKIVSVRALNGLNFHFNRGDRIGLLGNNGAGKTTLLKVIAGIFEPVKGAIWVKGRIASMLSLGLGFDHDATGYENIFILGAMLGRKKSEMQKYVDDICVFSELSDYINAPVRTYSSGMVMRLCFSVATSLPADIYLMDEWLSVGDTEFNTKAQARLHQLLDKTKILFLASQSEAMLRDTCNYIMYLEKGELVKILEL